MGRLGYQSDAQAGLAVSYNSLERYADSLHEALTRPHPAYEATGVRNPGGEYNQLATTLLQIENEFYSTIRPKRVIEAGERPLHALRQRGVEYVEVRCLDLDPFVPAGIATSTAALLDVFLLHCLLRESPPDSPEEVAALARNQERTATRGREPGLLLERGDAEVALAEWAAQVLDECTPIAQTLDAAQGGSRHREALRSARAAVADAWQLPSARVLETMRRDFDGSYIAFIREQSAATRRHVLALPWSAEAQARFDQLSGASIQAQQALQTGDRLSFDDFLQDYLSPARLRPASIGR
jgi:glutamate--cysteine ligase